MNYLITRIKNKENNIVIEECLEEVTVDDLIQISKVRLEKEREICIKSRVHPDFLEDDEEIEITPIENEEP